MTDARLFHTSDGGDIEYINGLLQLDDGFEGSLYLTFLGGNERDAGVQDDDRQQWWGNWGEEDPARQYRSRFGHLIRAIPITPSNRQRLQDAANQDAQWYISQGLADAIDLVVTIPDLNNIRLSGKVFLGESTRDFDFTVPTKVLP